MEADQGVDGDANLPAGGVDGDENALPRDRRHRRARAVVPNINASIQPALCILVANGSHWAIQGGKAHVVHPDANHLFDGEQTVAGCVLTSWTFFQTTDSSRVPDECVEACQRAQRSEVPSAVSLCTRPWTLPSLGLGNVWILFEGRRSEQLLRVFLGQ